MANGQTAAAGIDPGTDLASAAGRAAGPTRTRTGLGARRRAWLVPPVAAASALVAAAVFTGFGTAGGVRAIGTALAAGWVVVTVVASRAGSRSLAWVATGVTAVQAAAVGFPALGPVVVVAWAGALLTVPDGRLAGPGRRVLVGVLAAGAFAWSSALAATDPRTGASAGTLTVGVAVCLLLTTVTGLAGAGHASLPSRWALQWAAAGAMIALATGGVAGAFYLLLGIPARPVVLALAGWAALPLALAAGLDRRTARLAPRALVEAIVVAGLAVFVAGIYLVVVLGLGREPVGGERTVLALSLVAAFVAAALALPVRMRLADVAERTLRGTGPSPEGLLATFGTRMTRAVPMDELLLQLAELLRATMAPAGAEIWTGTGGTLTRAVSVPERPRARLHLAERELSVVTHARAAGNVWMAMWLPGLITGSELVRVAPVTHLGNLLGLLVVRRPAAGPPFAPGDDRILVDIARQIGLALHNVNLDTALQASLAELQERNADLQASRARIVSAADASRRRIERDLHDGAQQHLVGLAVKLGLARQVAEADPAMATAMLDELRGDVRAATAALRDLAHGIYPPLLRDQGLDPALRAAAGRSHLDCSVEVSGSRYPAEVEAAVYFCCLEALQNAGKHAGPDACIHISVEAQPHQVRFSVVDDGAGFDQTRVAGHGFVNMSDRVGAMGGHVAVTSAPGEGTAVRGSVPLDATAGE